MAYSPPLASPVAAFDALPEPLSGPVALALIAPILIGARRSLPSRGGSSAADCEPQVARHGIEMHEHAFEGCHLAFQGVNMIGGAFYLPRRGSQGCLFIAVNLDNLSWTKRPPFKTDFVQPPRQFHAAAFARRVTYRPRCAVIAVPDKLSGSSCRCSRQITHPGPERLRFLAGLEDAQRNYEKRVRRNSHKNVVAFPFDKHSPFADWVRTPSSPSIRSNGTSKPALFAVAATIAI
jgi:hypothetical protein